jgi:hypothetical protein
MTIVSCSAIDFSSIQVRSFSIRRDPDSLSRYAKIPTFAHFTRMFQDHLYDFFPIPDHPTSGPSGSKWHDFTIFDGSMKHYNIEVRLESPFWLGY